MNSRDNKLILLRPEIPKIDIKIIENEIELFQNETLRPIIKFNHDFWMISLKNYLEKRKNVFFNLKADERENYITSIFKSDNSYKKELLGNVLSFLTTKEIQYYFVKQNDINKRIINILKERFLDISKNM